MVKLVCEYVVLMTIGISFLIFSGCSGKKVVPVQDAPKPLVEAVPNLSLKCAHLKKKECKSEIGARCEFLKYNGEAIKRMKYDKESPHHTYIVEMNGGGQCESYWVADDCRIQSGTTCDQEEREILFGK